MKKLIVTIILIIQSISLAEETGTWKKEFNSIPKEAAPLTWWHWMNGHVTKDGITKDLEALKEVRVRGVILFDIGFRMPNGPVLFGSEAWWDHLNHAVKESGRLGLDFGVFNCPGFSQSGGPWITLEKSMKELTMSKTTVSKSGLIKLARPKSHRSNYYKDIAIVAYPTPKEEAKLNSWDLLSATRYLKTHKGALRFAKEVKPTPATPAENIVPLDEIVVIDNPTLKKNMFKWEAPTDGDWTLVRVGYTTTGRGVRPAVRSGQGLECDKLDPAAVRFHLSQYVSKIREKSKKIEGNPFRYLQSESWECYTQTWTANLDEDFNKELGYDLRKFLPLITTGQIIESVEVSEKMLWDWRRYLANRIARDYYKVIHDFAEENGMIHLGENSGNLQYLYDSVRYHRFSHIPMGEFWVPTGSRADVKNASSSAHITGRKKVAAEALTGLSELNSHPGALKTYVDQSFTLGVNLLCFHTFAHQPYDLKPGFSMGRFGHDFQRNNTWFSEGKTWIDYINRCQNLLRKGRSVNDVLIFTGEDIPNYLGFRGEQTSPVPIEYDYDGCDWEALKAAKVENGEIVLTSGTRYKLLVLNKSKKLRLPVAEKIKELVSSGATLVSSGFSNSPSLTDHGKNDQKVAAIGKMLFTDKSDHSFGKGLVLQKTIEESLEFIKATPDFQVVSSEEKSDFEYIHRQTDTADLYFVANVSEKDHDATFLFRATGKQPECWSPYSGEISAIPVYKNIGKQTELKMKVSAGESFFIIFDKPSNQNQLTSIEYTGKDNKAVPFQMKSQEDSYAFHSSQPGTIEWTTSKGEQQKLVIKTSGSTAAFNSPWKLEFMKGGSLPEPIELSSLNSLTNHPEEKVKYFSGTVAYRNTFNLSDSAFSTKNAISLSLGEVKNLVEVIVNGKSLKTLWKAPFDLDISKAVKSGKNTLELRVTNSWENRLIGDAKFGAHFENIGQYKIQKFPEWFPDFSKRSDKRFSTFSTSVPKDSNKPLSESGLLGPVEIKVDPLHFFSIN